MITVFEPAFKPCWWCDVLVPLNKSMCPACEEIERAEREREQTLMEEAHLCQRFEDEQYAQLAMGGFMAGGYN